MLILTSSKLIAGATTLSRKTVSIRASSIKVKTFYWKPREKRICWMSLQ